VWRSPGSDWRRGHVGVWLSAGVVLVAALVSVLFVGSAHPAGAAQATGVIAFTRADGIYVMRPDGSGVRTLRRGVDVAGLAWSPDGRRLAFVGGTRGTTPRVGVWVMDGNGRNLKRIVDSATVSPLGFLSWSPSGGQIVFTGSSRDGGSDGGSDGGIDLWRVNADGSDLRRLARTPDLVEVEVDYSPTGRIAVSEGVWTSRLYVMNANGSNRRLVSGPLWWGEIRVEEAMPDWSPDGGKLAFTRFETFGAMTMRGQWIEMRDSEIWVMKPNSRSRVRLTKNTVMDRNPTWSPDGRQIAFIRWGGRGSVRNIPPAKRSTGEIFVMDADGSNVTRLTRNKVGEGSPAWQPVPGAPDT
jgi:Tol biopolymer transport system component